MWNVPVMLAKVASPSDIESLSTRIGDLVSAVMSAMKWMHRGEGFIVCLALVVLALVFGASFAVVTWLLTRNK